MEFFLFLVVFFGFYEVFVIICIDFIFVCVEELWSFGVIKLSGGIFGFFIL